ncbi:MAG: alpha-amylase, partial [Anaerolineae bacterium]|nr:alpha-amylase [Anaerolineae bacterium]
MTSIFLLSFSFLLFSIQPNQTALADHTANPTSVTVAGSLQSEMGCPGDWQPDCAATHLGYDAGDDVWQGVFTVPTGSYEYKAPLNDSWDENYGANATLNGANIPLNLGTETSVKFYYDHKTHWIIDNQNAVIATVPGSFQSELGCPGDWDPGCLRSWLQDPDGDGTYAFTSDLIPPGSYEAKVTINESWDENYGVGGVQNGPNISFTVSAPDSEVTFSYDPNSHILTITVVSPGPAPDNNVEWDGVRHDSREPLYRTPGGAVPAGTPVTLRLRTFHNDVTDVKVRVFSLNAGAQTITDMALAASDVSCYQDDLTGSTCDFWEATLPNADPDNLWYRFLVTDGDRHRLLRRQHPRAGWWFGQCERMRRWTTVFALTVYDPSFTAPDWAQNAV